MRCHSSRSPHKYTTIDRDPSCEKAWIASFLWVNYIIFLFNTDSFDWQHLCYLCWTCFSTDSRHTYRYKLCFSSRRLVPLFVWGRLHTGASQEKRKETSPNFTFRYIDDVLSLNNSKFGDFVDRINPIELEIKDTTDTDTSASYLDLHLEIDSEGRLRTKLYDKRKDFNFSIVNFPFICSNMPAAHAYGVYISQLIRYSRACSSYQDFLDRGLLLARKLLNQRFLLVKLKSSLRKFYSRHHDLVDRYGISVTNDHGYVPLVISTSRSFPRSWLITGFVTRLTRRVSLVEQELATLSEHTSSPPVCSGVRVTRSLEREVWRLKIWFNPPFL